MKLHQPIRAAIYARVSSERQADAATIASQVAALRERVVADGIPLEDDLCFIDDGFTGTTLVRPALERLRDGAAAGDFDRLYVHSPDRLARKYAYQVLLVDELQRHGVEVVLLNRPVNDTPEDQLLLHVQGVIAEYERTKLLERCRRGKLHAARQGGVHALAGAPFGYRYVRKADGGGVARYDVVLEEARVVRQVFEWVGRERLTLGEVCRRLEAQDIRTRTGKEAWDSRTILDMLRQPAYTGTAKFGRTRVGPRRSRLRPPRGQPEHPRTPSSVYASDTPGIPIPVPALISEELFQAAAEQLDENRKRQRQSRRGARWLLQGLLVCPHCGYALYGLSTKHRLASGTTIEHAYYRCIGRNAHRFGGQRRCENRQVRVDALDDAVWQDVCALLRDPAKLQAEYERRLGDGEPKPSCVEEQLDRQIARLRSGVSRLIDSYQEGLLEKEEFEPRLRTARTRLARLEADAAQLADQRAQQRALRLALQGIEDFAARVQAGLETATWHDKREILCALVKRVEVGADEMRIVYRVSPPPFLSAPQGGAFQHCGGCLEPPLPDVPRGAVVAVIATGVRREQPLHPAPEVAVGVGSQYDVEVIGHQAVAQDIDGEALARIDDRLKEGIVIGGLVEDGLASVAAVEGVIPHAPDGGAGGAWHGITVLGARPAVNKRYVPLFLPASMTFVRCAAVEVALEQKTGIRVATPHVSRSEGIAGAGRLWVSGLPSVPEKPHESPPLYPRPVDGHRALHRFWLRRPAVGLGPLGECGFHAHCGGPLVRHPCGDGTPGAGSDDVGRLRPLRVVLSRDNVRAVGGREWSNRTALREPVATRLLGCQSVVRRRLDGHRSDGRDADPPVSAGRDDARCLAGSSNRPLPRGPPVRPGGGRFGPTPCHEGRATESLIVEVRLRV
jgi:site-specific DNA recombinase